MMKRCLEPEQCNNIMLRHWDILASNTRKPIECPFSILKQICTLLTVVRLLHIYDIVSVFCSCMVLHNRSIELHDYDDEYNELDYYQLRGLRDDIGTTQTQGGRRQRDALMYYCTNIYLSFSTNLSNAPRRALRPSVPSWRTVINS